MCDNIIDTKNKLTNFIEFLVCDDCKKASADVHKVYCPYQEEIYDELVEVQLCDDCYYDRCFDI